MLNYSQLKFNWIEILFFFLEKMEADGSSPAPRPLHDVTDEWRHSRNRRRLCGFHTQRPFHLFAFLSFLSTSFVRPVTCVGVPPVRVTSAPGHRRTLLVAGLNCRQFIPTQTQRSNVQEGTDWLIIWINSLKFRTRGDGAVVNYTLINAWIKT